MYLVQRHLTWWAFHDVPATLRKATGRHRFSANLRTRDRGRASIMAAVCEAQWLAEIERARHGADAVAEAAVWRGRLAAASNQEERLVIEDMIVDAGAAHAGLLDWRQGNEAGNEDERAKMARFVALASGDVAPLGEHLDEYAATLRGQITAKSLHMRLANLRTFVAAFPTTAEVQRPAIQRWVYAEAAKDVAHATLARAVGELRLYWKFLIGLGAAREIPDPFSGITVTGAKRKDRSPFAPGDLVKLEAKARGRGDVRLADFMLIAMYTGARAEEIVTLRCEHIDLTRGAIAVPGTKSEAARREVPIHPALLPVLQRLVAAAKNGLLFPGLRPDKFGDTSKPLTKRFTTLKQGTAKPGQDFHSIRRTVCTMFEDAGVAETIFARIVGHKIKSLSIGLYSGGPSLATKAAAIAKLAYPAAE